MFQEKIRAKEWTDGIYFPLGECPDENRLGLQRAEEGRHISSGSLDAYLHCVCRLSIHGQHDINFATPYQAAREAQVGLV